MSLMTMLGNTLWRDGWRLSLPVAEKILRELAVYLSALIE
jgi:hypothetical protein